MKKIFISITIVWLFTFGVANTTAQALLDIESGTVFTGMNDVRIPGDAGTFISLKDHLIPKTTLFYRIRLNYTIKSHHTFSLLYAPLEIKSEGKVPNDIFFEGVVFPGNSEIIGTYKFNSYRLTYRYDIIQNSKFELGLGLTAKIRDAKIALSSSGPFSQKTNVGFVPLINFRILWKTGDKFGLLLDGDALAAPQGRAEDILIAATYLFSPNLSVRAGYRILEGGADNDIVYNFALFHYTSVGFTYTFHKTITK